MEHERGRGRERGDGRYRVSLYEVLQVSPRAQPEVIRAAYRVLARLYHPDVSRAPDAAQTMRRLNDAYTVLGDSERRTHYDARIAPAGRVLGGRWRDPGRASVRGGTTASPVAPAGHRSTRAPLEPKHLPPALPDRWRSVELQPALVTRDARFGGRTTAWSGGDIVAAALAVVVVVAAAVAAALRNWWSVRDGACSLGGAGRGARAAVALLLIALAVFLTIGLSTIIHAALEAPVSAPKMELGRP